MSSNKSTFSSKCFFVLGSMLIVAISLLLFTQYKLSHTGERIDRIEAIDSIGVSQYRTEIAILKRNNDVLSDSLDLYKSKVRTLTQLCGKD